MLFLKMIMHNYNRRPHVAGTVAQGRQMSTRRHLATFGDIWRHLATFGDIWRHLATFGDIWRHLATSVQNWLKFVFHDPTFFLQLALAFPRPIHSSSLSHHPHCTIIACLKYVASISDYFLQFCLRY